MDAKSPNLYFDKESGKYLINRARVDLALMYREIDDEDFAETLGVTEADVEDLAMPRDYPCLVSPKMLSSISEALRFPLMFFLQGDEKEDFIAMEETKQQIESNIRGRELWIDRDSGLTKSALPSSALGKARQSSNVPRTDGRRYDGR